MMNVKLSNHIMCLVKSGKFLVVLILAAILANCVQGQTKCGALSAEGMQAQNASQFNKFNADLSRLTNQNLLPSGYYRPGGGSTNPQPSIMSTTILATDQVIPVVFHLIGNNATALTDLQVTAALARLNTDFNSTGTAIGASNPTIRFCLAANPPAGKSWTNSTTNGINRFLGSSTLTYSANGTSYTNTYDYIANHVLTSSPGSCYTPGSYVTYNELTLIESFTPSNYLNIYVVSQISFELTTPSPCLPSFNPFINNVGGFAAFYPSNTFVIRTDAISNVNSHTMTHEAGHYLSLYHTFEGGLSLGSTYNNTTTPCEYNGDRCCDTPPVYGNANTGNLNFSCATAGTTTNTVIDNYFAGGTDRNDMIENFMDYSDDDCKNTFTFDQIRRMKYTLAYYRYQLGSGINIVNTGISACANLNTVFSDFEPLEPGTNSRKEIGCVNELFDFKAANLPGYSYFWTVFPNTFTGTMLGFNPTNIAFTAPGTYTISLTVSRTVAGVTLTSATTQEIIITTCTAINNARTNWYIGDFNSISFATGLAKQAPNSLIFTYQPTASYCYNTTTGNTLYTDGRNLWCKIAGVHSLISSALNGSPNPHITLRSTGNKSTIICPRPGNATRLYIFTASNSGSIQNGLSQYEVDISTATPTLVSTTPIQPINNYRIAPSLTILPHENGSSYWLLVLPIDNSLTGASSTNIPNPNGSILAYLITGSNWQNNAPKQSIVGVPVTAPTSDFFGQSQLTASPDRKRLALARLNTTSFMNFDCNTGIANFVQEVASSKQFVGCFSPNSRFFYGMLNEEYCQYDLANISYCGQPIPTTLFGSLFNTRVGNAQIGPDQRIYISGPNYQEPYFNYLSVIANPNLLLNTTNNIGYSTFGVALPHYVGYGLPTDNIYATGATVNDYTFQNCNCGLVSFTSLKAGGLFAWSFGDGTTLTGTNGPIPLATHTGITYGNYEYPLHIYQAAGTYTVTLQVDGNPIISKVITIATAPPPKPIITPVCPVLAGTTFSCATVAASYFWQSDGTIIGAATSQTMLSSFASLPSAVRVTTTNTLGCSNATTEIVATSPSPCTYSGAHVLSVGATTLTVSPPASTLGYVLNANLTITGSITFTNTDIAIRNGASIIVASGGILTLEACHLHSCGQMWAGIVVQPGGRIIVRGNSAGASSLIEDAITAIDITGHSSVSTILNVRNTIFNKNSVSINISGYVQNIATYPFIIEGNVFTCREFPIPPCPPVWPNWPSVATLQTATTNTLNVLPSPYSTLTNFPVAAIGPTTELNSFSAAHIRVVNTGYTAGSIAAPVYSGMLNINTIGTSTVVPAINLFDNADRAIDARDANVKVVNSVIQFCNNGINATGTLYYTRPSSLWPYSSLQVLNSLTATNTTAAVRFYDNKAASINVSNYANVDILNNDFRSTQTKTSLTGIYGRYGIRLYGGATIALNVNNNYIYNHNTGIHFQQGLAPIGNSFSTLSQFPGATQIKNNVVRAAPIAALTGTIQPYVAQGIVAAMSGGPLNSTYTLVPAGPKLTIDKNSINNVYRGIEVTGFNFQKHSVVVSENNVSVDEDLVTSTTMMQSGIQCNNNKGSVYVKANTVAFTGTVPTTVTPNMTAWFALATPAARQSNYRFNQNDRLVVTCNTSNRGVIGFEFGGGTSWNTQFRNNNDMQNAHFLGVLLNTGAVIGVQPAGINTLCASLAPNIDAGNKWTSTSFAAGLNTPKSTWVQNPASITGLACFPGLAIAGAALSAMQVPATGVTRPIFNDGNGAVTTIYGGPTSNSLRLGATAATPLCASALPAAGNTFVSGTGNVHVLNGIALGMSFAAMSAQLNFTNQQYLYNLQKADSTYINATPETQTFYNNANATTSSFRKMYDIDLAIKQGNVALAQSLNNAFVPNSSAESNTKTYNTLAIKLLGGQSLTQAELSSLFSVASACPHTDAMCVYDARTLYNKILAEAGTAYYAFGDDCNPAGLYKQAPKQADHSVSFDAIIYPNPTTGSFVIQQLQGSGAQLKITIRDVIGRLVVSTTAQLVDNITTVPSMLAPGSYIVTIINENNETVVKKLVVQ
jgi:hypothetical protein